MSTGRLQQEMSRRNNNTELNEPIIQLRLPNTIDAFGKDINLDDMKCRLKEQERIHNDLWGALKSQSREVANHKVANETLTAFLSSKEAELERLKTDLQQTKLFSQNNITLHKEYEDMMQRIWKKLGKQNCKSLTINQFEHEINTLLKESTENRHEIDMIKEQSSRTEQTAKADFDEVSQLKQELNRCQQITAQLTADNLSLRAQIGHTQSINVSMRNSLAQIRQECNQLRTNHATQSACMRAQLDQHVGTAQMEIKRLHDEFELKRTETIAVEKKRRLDEDKAAKDLRDKNVHVNRKIGEMLSLLKANSIDVSQMQPFMDVKENQSLTPLDREIDAIKSNLAKCITLMNIVIEKCFISPSTPEKRINLNETCQEDLDESFTEVSAMVKQTLGEILTRTTGSIVQDHFLNPLNVNFEEIRSLKDMEEQFAMLSLNFNIDLRIFKKRVEIKRQQYNQLTLAFFQHLVNILKVMLNSENPFKKQSNLTSIIHSVSKLKNTASQVFEIAEEYGVLQYEYHNIKYWILVNNYVAELTKQVKGK